VCCYPDYERLLAAVADHARRLVVFSYPPRNPVSRGLVASRPPLRGSAVASSGRFTHPPAAMLAVVERRGFRRAFAHRALVWQGGRARARPRAVDPRAALRSPVTESCWRCGAEMQWRQSTWQCPRCHFKLGCCEGEPQSACESEQRADVPADAVGAERARRWLDDERRFPEAVLPARRGAARPRLAACSACRRHVRSDVPPHATAPTRARRFCGWWNQTVDRGAKAVE
jgi:hypothetical protein